MRYYLASADNKVLAGATCLDYGPTSLYLVAFLHPAGKQYHLGAAIIDRWFSDSRTLGLKYLDFDHMQDIGNPEGYAGYTAFKREFADFDMYFPSVWWRYL
jgi:Acetyltransferase (GNAT) domain